MSVKCLGDSYMDGYQLNVWAPVTCMGVNKIYVWQGDGMGDSHIYGSQLNAWVTVTFMGVC